ncbi:hypothetical protein TNCT_654561 [Trichonephila clavata]|uniref:Uncharacterized protein n=1 Tax=Trichonephila clavata TaxID=2740835 RepID=A0A8X6KSQ7_TRICU|nr:hypothetical protein TNCT_654561 [Trichonephila clavata]
MPHLMSSFWQKVHYMAPLNITMLCGLGSEFSEELEVLRLPLEKIPLSQRQLQLSQWIHYILMSNNIRVNIRLAAIIQKNVTNYLPPTTWKRK